MNTKYKKIIIYGAGKRGRWCLDFMKWKGLEDLVWGLCDKKYDEIRFVRDKQVVSYEEARRANLPFLVSCGEQKVYDDVRCMIERDGLEVYPFDGLYKMIGEEQAVFLREWCAFYHINSNDSWFEEAEDKAEIMLFWKEDTPFYKYFKELDLENVIELACGRGRHLPYYHDKAGKVTLVDILAENITFCKDRFKDLINICYYQNNGYDLEKLSDDSYTPLFTYDSVVHFEMMDVYSYLKDTYRVLRKGGRALFHHSAYDADPKTDFAHSPHARCFMNKDIFAYLAYRAGFDILSQTLIDWHGIKGLDCITLLEK